jgi:hypothetical protein
MLDYRIRWALYPYCIPIGTAFHNCRRGRANPGQTANFESLNHKSDGLGIDEPEATIGFLDLRLGLRRQLRLRRPGMGIRTHRQTQQRRGVLERATPVGEIIRSPRVAGPPGSEVDPNWSRPDSRAKSIASMSLSRWHLPRQGNGLSPTPCRGYHRLPPLWHSPALDPWRNPCLSGDSRNGLRPVIFARPALFTKNPTIGITVADGKPHESQVEGHSRTTTRLRIRRWERICR